MRKDLLDSVRLGQEQQLGDQVIKLRSTPPGSAPAQPADNKKGLGPVTIFP